MRAQQWRMQLSSSGVSIHPVPPLLAVWGIEGVNSGPTPLQRCQRRIDGLVQLLSNLAAFLIEQAWKLPPTAAMKKAG